MDPARMPTPEETEAALSGFGTVWRYILGAVISWVPIVGVWIWKASGEHAKFKQLDKRVSDIEEDFASISVVDAKLAACRDKQDKEHGEMLHDIVLDFKKEQAHTNQMLYLLLGSQGIKPDVKFTSIKDLRDKGEE